MQTVEVRILPPQPARRFTIPRWPQLPASQRFQRRRRSESQFSLWKDAATERSPFWQRRFHDFNVWSDKKRREKVHSMHSHRVRRGFVRHPKDWPWSRISFDDGRRKSLMDINPV